MNDRAKLILLLRGRIDVANNVIVKFKEKLNKDPSYAFEWAQDAFKHAATLEVCTGLLTAHETNENLTVEGIRANLTDETLRRARSPSFSTSVTSNLMDQYRTAERADLLDRMGWL